MASAPRLGRGGREFESHHPDESVGTYPVRVVHDVPSSEFTVLRDLCRALLAFRGEVAVVSLAAQVLRRYPRLEKADRKRFFESLRDEFGPDTEALDEAIESYRSNPMAATLTTLGAAAEPRRQDLLRRINMAPGGTAGVVAMRADLLALKDPTLAAVDHDFEHLLRSWFNRGFLTLEQISWESPAAVLERLIRYEAVHEIRSWDDLRRRLADDRRCYGFFHPALPGEPLIFIEIALVRGLASSIQAVIDAPFPGTEGSDEEPDTAIFYSITNCQAGLAGVPFGDLLIKQVAATVGEDVPTITKYSTLSPIPGFGRWLATQDRDDVLSELDQPDWHLAPSEAVRDRITSLCAYYLTEVKSGRWPADPVARFHLRNGARLERLNWLGDSSAKGLRESAGMMVNYLYDDAEVLDNHEQFLNAGVVAASEQVRALARARQ